MPGMSLVLHYGLINSIKNDLLIKQKTVVKKNVPVAASVMRSFKN